jgi:hypothetical protein
MYCKKNILRIIATELEIKEEVWNLFGTEGEENRITSNSIRAEFHKSF